MSIPIFTTISPDASTTTLAGITNILNRESGLLGISGLSNDMRTLVQAINDGNSGQTLPSKYSAIGWPKPFWH